MSKRKFVRRALSLLGIKYMKQRILFGALILVMSCSSSLIADQLVLLKDINLFDRYLDPYLAGNINNTLYFYAYDNENGYELWKTDFTQKGTTLVRDINENSNSSIDLRNEWYNIMNGNIYFIANDGKRGMEIWVSDGTADGTKILKDINPNGDGEPYSLTVYDNTLIFSANDGTHGLEPWVSDGTTDGTKILKDICPINEPHTGSRPNDFIKVGQTLFFVTDDGVHGDELWKSDFTPEGTSIVKDINPNGNSLASILFPSPYGAYEDYILFYADDGVHGYELWKSDGTDLGTMMVKDINSNGSSTIGLLSLDKFKDEFYFYAADEIHGEALWKTDGTEEGTVMVTNKVNGFSSFPCEVNGELYFTIYDRELWKTDGTDEGTVLVKRLKNTLYSEISEYNSDVYIERKNGIILKMENTKTRYTGQELNYNMTNSPNIIIIRSYNNRLFFVFNDGVHGDELWKSDGTPEGTIMVADIRKGKSGSNPQSFKFIDNYLYFVANDGVHGNEIWKYSFTDTNSKDSDIEGCFIKALLQ